MLSRYQSYKPEFTCTLSALGYGTPETDHCDSMTSTRSAYDITNPMIRETGEAVRSGDFQLYIKHFTVPFVLETFEGKHLIRSIREMEQHFEGVRQFRAENGIVASERENISATFHDANTIALIHVSHLFLADGSLFDRPYPTYSVIRRAGDRWLTQYCQYAVGDMDAFTRALMKFKESVLISNRTN